MANKIDNIPYLKILENAWLITWKNRFLWWFGFFLALASFGGISYPIEDGPEDFKNEAGQKIADFFSQHLNLVIIISVVFFVIFMVFLVLGIISRGALIDSIWKKIKGQAVNFKSGIKSGRENFWKVISINLALALFIFILIVLLVAPIAVLFLNKNYLFGVLMAIAAILIFIPIMILISFIKNYGLIYSVLTKMNFSDSLESAYNLFRKNILESIVMGLFFIPINLVVGLAILAVIITLGLIFVAIGFGMYFAVGQIGAIVVAIIGILIFIFLVFLIQSVYQVFSQAVWIFFFHEIAAPKISETVLETEIKEESISKPMPVIEAKKEN